MVMSFKNLLIAVLIFPLLAGCKKDNNKNTTPTLIAKWNLVTDYTANHLAQTNTYTSVPGDYFDFRSNGKCYIKEGNQYDTLTYAITSDTTISIHPFAINNAAYYSSKSNPLTLHAATITSAGPYPPGVEVDYRQVKLSR
jgi:hypothetical protein